MIKTKEKKPAMKEEKEEKITPVNLEVAAYYHWQRRGCPVNDDLTDWLAVEKGRNNGKRKDLS